MHSKLIKKKFIRTAIYMDTIIGVIVVTSSEEEIVQEKIRNVFEIFQTVENTCSRFDSKSELRQLSTKIGIPVKVSEILFQAISFALEVSKVTNGAFDPTLGYILGASGFDRNYLTGEKVPYDDDFKIETSSYQDVLINEENRTIKLLKPLILDLGAVAKGLAVDLAKKQLEEFEGFCIDAGGDIFAGGCNENDQPWTIGIRNPQETDQVIYTLRISDAAVCTSGSYERKSKVNKDIHHLLDPLSRISCNDMLSCTTISSFAMLADAFSTAAFILGQEKGLLLMEDNEVEGVIISPSMEVRTTKGIERYRHASF